MTTTTSTTSAGVFFDGGLMRSVEDHVTLQAGRRRHVAGASNSTLDARSRHDRRHAHGQRSRFSFTRRCQQVVASPDGRTRYLATHRRLGESLSRYICLEFVLRSDTVLQVGNAEHTRTSHATRNLSSRIDLRTLAGSAFNNCA